MPRVPKEQAEADDESARDGSLYVTMALLRGLFEHLQQRNIALDPVLEALGIEEEALADPDLRLPIDERLADAFAVAERLTDDANIGLHAGQSMQLSHLGIFGHLLMVCRRLEEIFDLHVRYQRFVGQGSEPKYEDLGDRVCLHFDRMALSPPPHVAQYVMSGWIRIARLLIGDDFRPLNIDMRTPQPADPSVAAARRR